MADEMNNKELLEKIYEHLNIGKANREKKVIHNTRGVITAEEAEEDSTDPGGDDDPDNPDVDLTGYVHFVGEIDCRNTFPFPTAVRGDAYQIIGSGYFGTLPVEEGEAVVCLAESTPGSTNLSDDWGYLIKHFHSTVPETAQPIPNDTIDQIMMGTITS